MKSIMTHPTNLPSLIAFDQVSVMSIRADSIEFYNLDAGSCSEYSQLRSRMWYCGASQLRNIIPMDK